MTVDVDAEVPLYPLLQEALADAVKQRRDFPEMPDEGDPFFHWLLKGPRLPLVEQVSLIEQALDGGAWKYALVMAEMCHYRWSRRGGFRTPERELRRWCKVAKLTVAGLKKLSEGSGTMPKSE